MYMLLRAGATAHQHQLGMLCPGRVSQHAIHLGGIVCNTWRRRSRCRQLSGRRCDADSQICQKCQLHSMHSGMAMLTRETERLAHL